MAAILLIASGVMLVGIGLIQPNYGFGYIPLAAGIPNLLTGVYVWRHHQWARLLGAVMAVLGIALGLLVLPSAFSPASEAGSTWPLIKQVLVLSIVPDVLVIVGLLLGGRHFRRA